MALPPAHGADLHTHTTCSDGALTPEHLVAAAVEKRLAAIAVTDHDTVAGVVPAQKAAPPDLEVIPGLEVGTPSERPDQPEIHLVGLFINVGHAELLDRLVAWRRARRDRMLKMIEKVNQAGVSLRSDEVFTAASHGAVSRLHLAQALVRRGVVHSIGAAFRAWLGPGCRAYVPRERPPTSELVALLHRAGALVVLAHPAPTMTEDEIARLVSNGIDAIEAYCPDHSWADEQRYEDFAAAHGLLLSAGSDCHGEEKGGLTLGAVRLAMDRLEALRDRARRYAQETHG